ncbi:tRNA (guanine(10)-N(2))-dimethyltransferase [Candidatus Woesearchaeota archaeon]|nr:tRNA (guanine(10)-N(2))-dimethyltransferase [Candidatus Woesearchaeota archaeon]
MKIIQEGSAKILAHEAKIVSKELEVFYNPVMKLNRDVSILLLNSIGSKKLSMALPLAGSGVRGFRYLLEVKKGIIGELHLNDYSQKAVELTKKNAKLNSISTRRFRLHNKDANDFLLQSSGFDYIDIDPFGTPNPFLDTAVKRLSRNGILAVTATDTSGLAGSHPKACTRKYWATPLKNEFMHETALRILIRKVQLIGAQYQKALIPIFSYSKHHYYRVFFQCNKGKLNVDELLQQHGYLVYCRRCLWHETRTLPAGDSICKCRTKLEFAGELWLGNLWDELLCAKMQHNPGNADKALSTLIARTAEESTIRSVGFYTLPRLAETLKLKTNPKVDDVIKTLEAAEFKASRTHFDGQGIRTDANPEDFKRILC